MWYSFRYAIEQLLINTPITLFDLNLCKLRKDKKIEGTPISSLQTGIST